MPAPWEKYAQPQQVSQNPMFPGQMQGQTLGNAGQDLTNREKSATLPYAAPTAEANLTRTQQSIGNDKLSAMTALTDKFDNNIHVKRYRTALPELAKALSAPDNAAGDLAVVYSFAKINDPIGAVRGEDTEMAQGTASLTGQLKSYVNMINAGKRLPPDARKNLLDTARKTVAQYDRAYIGVRKQYEGFAKQGGFDPVQIMGPHDGDAYRPVEMEFLRNTGQLKRELNPEASKAYDAMFRGGASYEDVAKFAQSIGAAAPDRKQYEAAVAQMKAGAPTGGASVFTESPMTGFNRIANNLVGPADIGLIKGGKEALDRAAIGLEQTANLLPFVDSNSAEQAAAQSDAMFAGLPSSPGFETAGRLGASALLSAPLRSPALAGAAGNAMMTDSTGGDLAVDAGLGAVGGKVGDIAIRGVTNLLAPSVSPALRALGQQGYRATPGQLFGRQAKNLEDRLTANPVLGPKIDALRDEGVAQFNRIPANRALGHIGQTLPDDVPAGHAAVDYTRTQLGNAYDNALAGQTIAIDPTYITRLNALGARLNMSPENINRLSDIVQREVGGAFQSGPLPGQMSGRTFKKLDERLGDLAKGLMKSDDPFQRDIGLSIKDIKDQTRALARRQNPQMGTQLRNADEGYADYAILRQAAQSSPADGIFTPGQLRTAVRMNDRSVGKGATARGQARMQDLASDASEVIPSGVGSSGTSEREQVNRVAPWVIGSALSPLYSDVATNFLNKTMLRNPDPVSQFIADRLRTLPRGAFGGSLPLLIGSN